MKFIPKYFQGSLFTPTLNQMSVLPPQTSANAESKEEVSEGILTKEMAKELMKSGLINDVDTLIHKIEQIEGKSKNPYNNISSQRATLQIIGEISKVKRNHELWKGAYNTAKTNQSLNDVAISSQGGVYIRSNKGQLEEISMMDYSKIKDKKRALTVNDLLLEREGNYSLAFNTSIFDPINNSIGLVKVNEELNAYITKLKPIIRDITTTYDNETLKKQKRELQEVLKLGNISEKDAVGIAHALQEISEVLSSPGEAHTNKRRTEQFSGEQYNTAISAIMGMLSAPAKQRLNFETINSDVKDSKGNYSPSKYLLNYMSGMLQDSIITSLTPIDIPGGEGSGKTKTHQVTPFLNLHTGIVRVQNQEFALNDAQDSQGPGLGFMFNGAIAASSPLVDIKNNSIGMKRLDVILNDFNYGQFVDASKIYAGKVKVTAPEQFIYDGETALNVFLPTTVSGTVDHDSLDRFKEVYNKFEANKAKLTKAQARELFSKERFNVTIEGEGKDMKISANSSGAKPFLVMYAYTTEKAQDLKNYKKSKIPGDTQFREVSSDTFDRVKDTLAVYWKDVYGSGKNATEVNNNPGFGNIFNRNNLRKTIIYIPYTNMSQFTVASLAGAGPTQDVATVEYANINVNARKISGVSTNNIIN